MAWSEWKKFGSYSKYYYVSASGDKNTVTVPEDCTNGILLVLSYLSVESFNISDGTGIVSKTPIFENIGTGGIGYFKMYGYNCTFNKSGTFTISRTNTSYAFDVLILY